ncbi:MAG TPA: hypothetical protein VGP15_12480, partial [Burkholderiales bacterium]|nr:hypothetical protein [Burkholderiales bacterium]
QTTLAGPVKAPLTENEIRELLVWNSPWEGRAAVPGRLYSYRTIFHIRRDEVIAEVMSYATNQRSDSVVEIRNGRLQWQDSNGADVSVAVGDTGELTGTVSSRSANLPIILKPRP